MSVLTGWRKSVTEYLFSTVRGVDKIYFHSKWEQQALFELTMQEDFRPVRKFFKLESFGEKTQITRLLEDDYKAMLPGAVTGN